MVAIPPMLPVTRAATQHRPGSRLANLTALVRQRTSDLTLDPIQLADALYGFGRSACGRLLEEGGRRATTSEDDKNHGKDYVILGDLTCDNSRGC